MLKRFLFVASLAFLVTLTAVASDREDDVNRTHKAAQVFTGDHEYAGSGHSSRSTGLGEMYRHHSRGREVRLYIRR